MDAQALLTPDAVEQEMGRPLAHVPDQAGDCHASYARHHAQTFFDTFAGLGIRPDQWYWMSEIYASGAVDPFIRTALDRAERRARDLPAGRPRSSIRPTGIPLAVICEQLRQGRHDDRDPLGRRNGSTTNAGRTW